MTRELELITPDSITTTSQPDQSGEPRLVIRSDQPLLGSLSLVWWGSQTFVNM